MKFIPTNLVTWDHTGFTHWTIAPSNKSSKMILLWLLNGKLATGEHTPNNVVGSLLWVGFRKEVIEENPSEISLNKQLDVLHHGTPVYSSNNNSLSNSSANLQGLEKVVIPSLSRTSTESIWIWFRPTSGLSVLIRFKSIVVLKINQINPDLQKIS